MGQLLFPLSSLVLYYLESKLILNDNPIINITFHPFPNSLPFQSEKLLNFAMSFYF